MDNTLELWYFWLKLYYFHSTLFWLILWLFCYILILLLSSLSNFPFLTSILQLLFHFLLLFSYYLQLSLIPLLHFPKPRISTNILYQRRRHNNSRFLGLIPFSIPFSISRQKCRSNILNNSLLPRFHIYNYSTITLLFWDCLLWLHIFYFFYSSKSNVEKYFGLFIRTSF